MKEVCILNLTYRSFTSLEWIIDNHEIFNKNYI